MNESGLMIRFIASSSVINGDESKEVLNKIKLVLESYPKSRIVVKGFASSDGSKGYNQKLSEQRAEALKAYLISLGVESNRIETVGYGESKPIEDNKYAKGRKQNGKQTRWKTN